MKSLIRPLASAAVALIALAARPSELAAQGVQPSPPPWRWLWIGSSNPADTWGSPNSLNPGALTGNFLLFPNNTPAPPIFRPNTGSDEVVIDPGQMSFGTLGEPITGTVSCRIESSSTWKVGRISLAAGTSLSLGLNSTLRVTTVPATGYPSFAGSGAVIVDGDIRLNAGAGDSALRFGTAATIGGNGFVTMVDATFTGGSTNYIGGDTAGLGLVIGSGFTIRGGGYIGGGAFGAPQSMNITNNGTFDGTGTINPLTIFLSNLIGSNLTNNGTLRASGGGSLRFNSLASTATIFNTGSIQALTGSTVLVGKGITVSGGNLATAGTGVIRGEGGGGVFSNVTNTGTIAIGFGETVRLAGTFTNNGSVNFDSTVAGGGGNIFLAGNVTLAGTGNITLKVESLDAITNLAPASTLTNSASHTIRGAGQLTSLGSVGIENTFFFTLANAGLVDANVPGKSLVITLRDVDNGRVTNVGTMRASSGGILAFDGNSGIGTVTNAGGLIQALDGSRVLVRANSVINGGTLATSGTGMIRPGGNGGTFTNVTNSGAIGIGFGETVRLAGTFTNNGSVNFDSTVAGGGGNLFFAGDVTLAGTGSITLKVENQDIIDAINVNSTLTNSFSHTIKGSGVMGPGSVFFAFANAGVVDANVLGKSLTFITRDASGGSVTNTGTLRASGGGLLTLASNSGPGTVTNTGGRIEALDASVVNVLGGVTVTGGMLAAIGTGVVRGGVYGVVNGGTFANLTTTGKFDPTLSTISGVVSSAGTVTVSTDGGATLASGATFNNLAGATVNLTSTGGFTGSGTFNNIGTLTKSGSGQAVFTGTTFLNTGTVAVNAGALAFGTFTQSAGTLRFTGGTSASVGSGQSFQFTGGALAGTGTITGNAVNAGALTIGSTDATTSAITISGNFTQNAGAILNANIGGLNAGNFGMLTIGGAATLAGTVNVNLVNGFKFRVGDSFRLVSAGSVSGAFSGVTLPAGVQGTLSANGTGVTLTITVAPPAATLINIATRARVETVDNVMIAGFVITGSTSKKVIVRAIGPSLTAAGVSGALSNPTLTLYNAQAQILATNDDWRSTQQAEIIASTFPPSDNRESAIVATLPAGAYTAIVSGVGGEMGVGLVEVYDLDLPNVATARPINVATRARVLTGDSVMIAGFVIGGTRPRRVIVRAIGPSLTAAGVPGALADPTLTLYNAQAQVLATNDNWRDTQQAEIAATPFPPSNDLESAIVATLDPGAYTAIVAGKNGTIGVGLVEVYDLE